MGAARCRRRYLALSAVLAGRCPRCWSRRRPGRGGPGREAVPGAAVLRLRRRHRRRQRPRGRPRLRPAAARGHGGAVWAPPARRSTGVPARGQRGGGARAGIRAEGRSGGRVGGWKPVPEPPRPRRTPVAGSQSRDRRAPGSPVPPDSAVPGAPRDLP